MSEADKLQRQMQQHAEHMEEFITKICNLPNSKVMSEAKYRQISAYLKDTTIDLVSIGVPRAAVSKFKWHVNKKKEYELCDFPAANLVQVVCVKLVNPVSICFLIKIFVFC